MSGDSYSKNENGVYVLNNGGVKTNIMNSRPGGGKSVLCKGGIIKEKNGEQRYVKGLTEIIPGLKIVSSGSWLRARAEQNDSAGKLIAKAMSKGELVPLEYIVQIVLANEKIFMENDTLCDGLIREPDAVPEIVIDIFQKKWGLPNISSSELYVTHGTSLSRVLFRDEGRTDDNQETAMNRLRIHEEYTKQAINDLKVALPYHIFVNAELMTPEQRTVPYEFLYKCR